MKKTLKRAVSLFLTIALLVCLSACSGSSDVSSGTTSEGSQVQDSTNVDDSEKGTVVNQDLTGEAVERDVVNVGINPDPGDLSPFGPQTAGRTAMANQIWQSLAHVIDGEIVGVLMDHYELAEDESYMDVYLYDYIYDQAGVHLTANDVKFSFDKCREIGNVNGIGFVESCEVVSDYVARFNFNTTLYVYDIETLFENLFICTQESYEATPSMSRRGKPYDDAMAENFFSIPF